MIEAVHSADETDAWVLCPAAGVLCALPFGLSHLLCGIMGEVLGYTEYTESCFICQEIESIGLGMAE